MKRINRPTFRLIAMGAILATAGALSMRTVSAQTAPGAPMPTPPAANAPTPLPTAPPQRLPSQRPMSMPPGMFPPAPPPPSAPPSPAMLKPAHSVTMPAVLNISGVAAIVNGEKITNEDLVKDFLRNGAQPTLNEAVTEMELAQAARKAHVTVTAAEIDARLKQTKLQFMQRYAGQSWSNILASKGLSEEYARDQTKLEIVVEKLAAAGQPFSLAGKEHVYHLLIATSPLPNGKGGHSDADALKQINQIAQDIADKKITFFNAARKYSDDTSNAQSGGDLGWISQSDPLDADFKKAAFALKEGQVSGPVKSQFGYHLIYLVKLGEDATAAEAKQAADNTLQERARPLVQQYVQQLQASAKVQDLLIPIPPVSPSAMMMRPGSMPPQPRPMQMKPMPPTSPAPTPPPVPTQTGPASVPTPVAVPTPTPAPPTASPAPASPAPTSGSTPPPPPL